MSADAPLGRVREMLDASDTPYFFLDQVNVDQIEVRLASSNDGSVSGVICAGSEVLSLSDVTSAYLRPYDILQLTRFQGLPRGALVPLFQTEQDLYACFEVLQATVVNRPSSMASNASKPYQLSILPTRILKKPATIITSDRCYVEEFRTRFDKIIYKSISGCRSIVSILSESGEDQMENLQNCPVLFQEYLPGHDVRVHVLGSRIFPCSISSSAADYRYSQESVLAECDIPDDIAEECVNITNSLGLCFSGIDLRLTPSGEWYVFEVNPSPGYSYYDLSGTIATELAHYLSAGLPLSQGASSRKFGSAESMNQPSVVRKSSIDETKLNLQISNS